MVSSWVQQKASTNSKAILFYFKKDLRHFPIPKIFKNQLMALPVQLSDSKQYDKVKMKTQKLPEILLWGIQHQEYLRTYYPEGHLLTIL